MLSTGIIMGLIAMLFWGFADFLYAIATKKLGSAKMMFTSNIVGLAVTLGFLVLFYLQGKIYITQTNFFILFIGGIIDTYAVYMFFRSFEIGDISVVAPISATFSLVTVILAVIFLGENISVLKAVSIIVIVAGIVLTSTDIKKLKNIHTEKGVKEAIIALFLWGIYFFIMGIVSSGRFSEKTTYINVFVFTGLINGVLMASYGFFKGGMVKIKDLKPWYLPAIFMVCSVFYTCAWLAVNYGISLDLVSLVTPVSSLYPAITVILAGIFLKEKLVLNQKIGVVVILVGIFLISL